METARRVDSHFESNNVRKSSFPKYQPKVAALLPANRQKESGLTYSDDAVSLCAHVRKGMTRRVCQDTAIILVNDKFSLIGIFDGFERDGGIVSNAVAECVLEMSHNRRMQSKGDLVGLLNAAVAEGLNSITLPVKGGTTALLSLILPDRKYITINIGDSGFYLIKKGGVSRMFDYNQLCLDSQTPPVSVIKKKLHYLYYAVYRNILAHSITMRGMRPGSIESAEGFLEDGDCLVLASDGLAKNLTVNIDEKGILKDVSGCADLSSIVKGSGHPPVIMNEIVSTISRRIDDAVKREKTKPSFYRYPDGTVLLSQDDDFSITVLSAR